MSYHYTFDSGATYGVKDVNKITSRFVTAGIAQTFTENSQAPYNLSSFHETGALMFQSGVKSGDASLQVVKTQGQDGAVSICPGKAFFHDGTLFEVTLPEDSAESDVVLSYVPGVKHYVYLKNDYIFSNSYYPVCTTDAPTGDFVPLAEIETDGAITDRREYAVGKLPSKDSGYAPKQYEVTVMCEPQSTPSANGEYYRYFSAEGQATVTFGDDEDLKDRRFVYIYDDSFYRTAGVYDLVKQTHKCSVLDYKGVPKTYSAEKLYLYYRTDSDYISTTISVNTSDNQLSFDIMYDPKNEFSSAESFPYSFSFILI